MKTRQLPVLVLSVFLLLGLVNPLNAQLNRLKGKIIDSALNSSTSKTEKEVKSEDVPAENSDGNSQVADSAPAAVDYAVEEHEPDKEPLPDYFSSSDKFDDPEITEQKITELFKKYEKDCAEVLQIWIGELDSPEEWHIFKNGVGVPEFMRTNRYFSVAFKATDGNCYYTWNNLAMRRDYTGGGKYGDMRIASVRYRKVEFDCP